MLTLNLYVGGSVLTALLHSLMLAYLAIYLVTWMIFGMPLVWFGGSTWLNILTIAAGYAGTAAVALIGLSHRGKLREGWWLLMTPFYWTGLSIAAWRALSQFVWAPYHWEKTEHGLVERLPWNEAQPPRRARREPLRDSA